MKAMTRNGGLWRVLLLAVLLVGLLPGPAAQASQPFRTKPPIPSTYKGWAHAKVTPRHTLDMAYINGYVWTGSRWRQCGDQLGDEFFFGGCFAEGERVYAWPFGSGWHWAWTQQRGWVAVRTSDLTY
jgi:hypothetical protein